jgi:hypothetical protein
MGSSPEEIVQRGGSSKNGRRLHVERSSGSGTRLSVDGGGGSDVRPGDGVSKQVRSALAPATRVLKGGGGSEDSGRRCMRERLQVAFVSSRREEGELSAWRG